MTEQVEALAARVRELETDLAETDADRSRLVELERNTAAQLEAARQHNQVVFAATIGGVVAFSYLAASLGLGVHSTTVSAVELAASIRDELADIDLDSVDTDGAEWPGEWPTIPALDRRAGT